MNLRRYLMIKQAVLTQQEFQTMRGPNAGKLTRNWSEWANWGIGGGNALKNRQAAADANAYTEYLKSQGLGANALSKEDFLAKNNTPKLGRTWGEWGTTNIFGGGSGAQSWKNRQDKADTDAYNAYLKENANNQAMLNNALGR